MNDHEEFDDIPGTTVFTTKRSRQGFQLNQFCMCLMKDENRERFKRRRAGLPGRVADDRGAKAGGARARLQRARSREGGNIYFLAKIFATDGQSFQHAAALMTGMSQEEYAQ